MSRLGDITAIWEGEPEAAQTVQVDQHGGRIEQRRLWTSDLLAGYSDWPHLAQVCRLERTGSASQVMAALRNLTISVIRLAGETNIAAARYIHHVLWL